MERLSPALNAPVRRALRQAWELEDPARADYNWALFQTTEQKNSQNSYRRMWRKVLLCVPTAGKAMLIFK
jgi:hypothetical protein